MADWTDQLPQAARDYIEGHRLDEVECIISDLPGIARGKAVPASKFAKQAYFSDYFESTGENPVSFILECKGINFSYGDKIIKENDKYLIVDRNQCFLALR